MIVIDDENERPANVFRPGIFEQLRLLAGGALLARPQRLGCRHPDAAFVADLGAAETFAAMRTEQRPLLDDAQAPFRPKSVVAGAAGRAVERKYGRLIVGRKGVGGEGGHWRCRVARKNRARLWQEC